MSYASHTLRSCAKEFLNYMTIERNYSKHTTQGYLREISQFLKFLGSDYSIDSITTGQIREWLLSLKGYKSASIARKIIALKALFNFCEEQEWIVGNPARKIKTPKRANKVPEYLTQDELKQVLDTNFQRYLSKPNMRLDIRDATIVRVLIFCGLRRSEIIGLNMENVSLPEGLITIREAKMNKDRVIPLTRDLNIWLKKYLAWKEVTYPQPKDPNALFLSYSGNRIDYCAIQKLVKKHLRASGITKRVTVHGLRHSFATSLVKRGVDIFTVSQLLGHSNLQSTQIYLHADLAQKQLAVERLASFVNNDQLKI